MRCAWFLALNGGGVIGVHIGLRGQGVLGTGLIGDTVNAGGVLARNAGAAGGLMGAGHGVLGQGALGTGVIGETMDACVLPALIGDGPGVREAGIMGTPLAGGTGVRGVGLIGAPLAGVLGGTPRGVPGVNPPRHAESCIGTSRTFSFLGGAIGSTQLKAETLTDPRRGGGGTGVGNIGRQGCNGVGGACDGAWRIGGVATAWLRMCSQHFGFGEIRLGLLLLP